jgi:hypothetical protein
MVEPTVSLPFAMIISAWRWVTRRALPSPVFHPDAQQSQWSNQSDISQWTVSIGLKKGWLRWKNSIADCRLYLIRRDFGQQAEPEGIWLKWIVDGKTLDPLATTLTTGKTYRATVVVRDVHEGTAYIANQRFIESDGAEKKWRLPPGRNDRHIDDPFGRYTFWIEVRSGKAAWRSSHYYSVSVPPSGQGNASFTLEILKPPPPRMA